MQVTLLRILLIALLASLQTSPARAARRFPNILLIAVDTLRCDRLGSYGYGRDTSPAIDRLLATGARFTEMRVVEPLTAPSMCSLFTSRYPHEHGATRNGLAMRPNLPSLGKVLARRGYETVAFVGNWTLRGDMTGMDEHFEDYREVFTRKRYFGLFNAEATGDDLTSATLEWIEEHLEREPALPFFVWAHYVEPHAPYRPHEAFRERLQFGPGELSRSDRYDMEVAFADRAIDELLRGIRARVADEDLMVIFFSDHGESLGEHSYWGHGRHLYEPTLHVPFGVTWPGRIVPRAIEGLASSLDVAPTVLGLLGLKAPEAFRGHDWSPMLRGDPAPPPAPLATFHQAHKGAIRGGGNKSARRNGLLEVGWTSAKGKELFSLRGRGQRMLFRLAEDPEELAGRSAPADALSEPLAAWLGAVRAGLAASDELPAPVLEAEDVERLRALGYLDN